MITQSNQGLTRVFNKKNQSNPQRFANLIRISDIDPPGHRRIGGHYRTWCPSVRPSQIQERATTDTMRENNENLLAGVWWVILNSLDFFFISMTRYE